MLEDVRRTYRFVAGGRAHRLVLCLRAPGVQAMAVYRFGRWVLRRHKLVRLLGLLDLWYQILALGVEVAWGIEIPRRARIGAGFYVGHSGGIVISSEAVIGRNCSISQGVTIGAGGQGARKGVPTVGDDVYIAPGACLYGRIRIGNNVKIGANAVIYKDVPDNAVVALDPGFRVLSLKGNHPLAAPETAAGSGSGEA
ncbi:MAG TPA: serine acetyltransferase [Polyangia bacterium]|nr:serine acetyltransferase [Polyangia bacterium]